MTLTFVFIFIEKKLLLLNSFIFLSFLPPLNHSTKKIKLLKVNRMRDCCQKVKYWEQTKRYNGKCSPPTKHKIYLLLCFSLNIPLSFCMQTNILFVPFPFSICHGEHFFTDNICPFLFLHITICSHAFISTEISRK